MEHISTQNLLILHMYGETTPAQEQYLANLLASDESLRAELAELSQAQQILSGKKSSPSDTSIRIIMDYSHKSEQLHEA